MRINKTEKYFTHLVLCFCKISLCSSNCQEERVNVFHMCSLRRIMENTWQDKVTNKVVLEKAGIPSLYTLLKQRHMQWLGHVTWMEDGCIPKDLLYGELATGKDQQDDPN